MRRALLLLPLLLASPAEAADTWTYASSEHFEVYTTAGAGTARQSLAYFERIHAFFAQQLRLSPNQKVPTRLIIFSNDRQFAPYRPNEVAAAFYQSAADRDYIVMGRFDEDSTDIVAHEYVHLIIKYSNAKFPVWLNEGLGEFFSTATPEAGRMSYGRVPRDRLFYLRSGVPLIDIRRLLSIGHDSPEYNTQSHAGVFYSESWALTHMLALDDRYRDKWDRFREAMAGGANGADAMVQILGKTPETVFRDLVNYIQRSQFLYRQTDYRVPPDIKYETRVADPFEADLVTTNLLGNSRSGEEAARAGFDKLEQQKPNDIGLLESRAYFELHRGERDAARPYFERAIAQGSQNVKLMVDYARLDSRKAAALIEKAMAIAPDNPDVRIEHARQLMRDGRSADAVRSFQTALRVDRQQAFEMGQILANAYMQLNRIEDARSAAQIVAQYAEEGPQTEFAKRLVKSVDDYAARRTTLEQRARDAAGNGRAAADGATGAPLAPGTVPPTAASVVSVTGRLRNVICQPGSTVLELFDGGQTLRLVIDDTPIRMLTGSEAQKPPAALMCGAQDQKITIGYVPAVDQARTTVGYVRVLDYR